MKEHISDYFEGILQIRNGNNELLDWIYDKIKADKKAKVTKAKKVTNGADLYITDQHYLQNLGRKIQEHQTGILKVSRRLHTQDKVTSRHVYRVTVLFKAVPFKRGDIATVHGEKVQIVYVDKKAQVKDLKTGAKRFVDLELLKY